MTVSIPRIESNEIAVLQWAMNPALPVPEVTELDEGLLVELALSHRVPLRLFARLEKVRLPWCSVGLRNRLRLLQVPMRRRMQVQMEAAHEITRAMCDRGVEPPIFVKGFAAYAISGDRQAMSLSGDLDLFAADLPALWGVLQELGYVGKRKHTHEWAKLMRGDITLDIHEYFPILSYPPDVREASCGEMDPQANSGHWSLPNLTREYPAALRMLWEDIASPGAAGVVEGTQGLLFPNPTVLCFLHCCHSQRSFVQRLHYLTPSDGLRLQELATIRDLTRHQDFSWQKFGESVRQFQAQDALRFTNAMCRKYLGEAPFSSLVAEEGAEHCVPLSLPFGGWVTPLASEKWLPRLEPREFLSLLGSNILPADGFTGPLERLPRTISSGYIPVLGISVRWSGPDRIIVEWTLPMKESLPDSKFEFLLLFGWDSSCRVLLLNGSILSAVLKSDYLYPHQAVETSFAVNAKNENCLCINCPVPSLLPETAASTELPLLLAIRRLSRHSATKAVIYLPVALRRKFTPETDVLSFPQSA